MPFAPFIFVLLAAIAGLAGWIWLIVLLFKNDEKLWGTLLIVSIVIPIGPFVLLALAIAKWSLVRRPAILIFASTAVSLLSGFWAFSALKSYAEEAMLAQVQAAASAAAPPGMSTIAEPVPQTEAEVPATPPAPMSSRRAQTPAEPRTADDSAPGQVFAAQASSSPGEAPPDVAANASPKSVLVAGPPLPPPIEVDFVALGEPGPNELRAVRARLRNPREKAIREIKVILNYYDARGARLGGWTTIHGGLENLSAARATNEFEIQAFFVPQFARNARIDLETVVFADGARWPEVSP